MACTWREGVILLCLRNVRLAPPPATAHRQIQLRLLLCYVVLISKYAMSDVVGIAASTDGPAQAEVSRHPVSWDVFLNWICPVFFDCTHTMILLLLYSI